MRMRIGLVAGVVLAGCAAPTNLLDGDPGAAGGLRLSAPEREARTIWPQAGYGATVSPDGKLAAYVNWDRGDVAVFDLAVSTTRTLMNTGTWYDGEGFADEPLVFSRDGSRIAHPFLGTGFRYQLRTVAVGNAAIASLDALPAESPQLAPLAWHPEIGIAYAAGFQDRSWEVRVVDPESAASRVVTAGDHSMAAPDYGLFTPDGRFLLYLAGDTLYGVSVVGGQPVRQAFEADVLLGWDGHGRTLLVNGTRDGVTGNWAVAVENGRPAGAPVLARRTAEGVLPGGWTA